MTTRDLSVCVIGHVDAGKSSLTGRILVQNDGVKQRDLEKLKAAATSINRPSFYLAHTMDTNPEEKSRGITITSATKKFTTKNGKRDITIIDAPGHRDFINNMITGAAQCNAAILVISAVPSEFRAGIAASGQTMEHTLLINALGVEKIIVAVNKMDTDSVNYSESVFNEVKNEVIKQYKKINSKVSNLQFVPISGYLNANIDTNGCEKMPWYKGPCLMDLIDSWPEITYDLSVPFRMAISDILKVQGAGTIYTGKVYTGMIKVGTNVEMQPSGVTAQIKTIEKFHKPAQEAYPDESIGLSIKGIKDDKAALIRKGNIMGDVNSNLRKVKRFIGKVMFNNNIRNEVNVGFKPVLSVGTARVAVTLVKIDKITDRKQPKKNMLDERVFAKKGEIVLGSWQTDKTGVCLEDTANFGILRRFVLRNSNTTIAIGVCMQIDNDNYIEGFRVDKKKEVISEKKKK